MKFKDLSGLLKKIINCVYQITNNENEQRITNMELIINKFIRSKRRTIASGCRKVISLTVRAPLRVPDREIFKLIEEKKNGSGKNRTCKK